MTLDDFRALVLADEALQMDLARIDEPGAFVARVLELAGPGFATEDLAAAIRPDPVGITRLATPPNASAWPSRHWLPVQAMGPSIDWAHFAGAALAEPFFTESARRAMARPFNSLFRHVTAPGDFVANAESEGSLPPDGFIFHMSRCGSTLVAQMLAALPGSIVVSEAAPLAAAIASGSPDALSAMVAALGRRRAGDETRYFLKLDFGHALALPLFRAAFPAVPWVFLYREPVEVLVSQMRLPGLQALASPDRPREEAYAEALAVVCDAALAALDKGGGLAVNHADLPGAAASILGHFGSACGAGERALMEPASRRHAKAPETPYSGDADAKRRAATDAVRRAAEIHLAGPYRRLEALRRPF
ncbi:MAG TPA: hypothetical protein VEW71_05570 [Allosphingosinicella sp.]|nr:hypothetical protein [Allosphingosinicella sp.]